MNSQQTRFKARVTEYALADLKLEIDQDVNDYDDEILAIGKWTDKSGKRVYAGILPIFTKITKREDLQRLRAYFEKKFFDMLKEEEEPYTAWVFGANNGRTVVLVEVMSPAHQVLDDMKVEGQVEQ